MLVKYIILIICTGLIISDDNQVHPYKGCYSSVTQLTIWLSKNGHCLETDVCSYINNCTTFYGSIIIRSTVQEQNIQSFKPYFPDLVEITGFLVVTFFNLELFDILPSLAVVRGQKLVANYAIVIYYNDLKTLNFPSLTTILNGGVRVAKNSQLCYADGVRWKSIVKDKYQESKYGIVIKLNNEICDNSCVIGQCYAAPGHSNNPKAQYCWGSGSGSDYQCQKFCDEKCSLNGCVEGSTSRCCHKDCLGGCIAPDSPRACYACLKYRMEETGKCVDDCPSGYFKVNKLTCERSCPGWSSTKSKTKVKKYYNLDGECVVRCPAGHIKDDVLNKCQKCINDSCPRVCKLPGEQHDGVFYNGAIIKLPSDIHVKRLDGCTKVIGSLTIELQDGTGNLVEFCKSFKWLKVIEGHLKIQRSSLKLLDCFTNLEKIDPPSDALVYNRYAMHVYNNDKLEELWNTDKNIIITRGNLFFQSNPRLCPHEIYKLQSRMKHEDLVTNVTGDISKESNGNIVPCDVERLEMKVEEITPASLFGKTDLEILLKCVFSKCVVATWNFLWVPSAYRIVFYAIYYRKLNANEQADKQVIGDFVGNEKWKIVDVAIPIPDLPQRNTKQVHPLKKYIANLTPKARYAFYLKEVVSVGEERNSKIYYITISTGRPSAPVGFEASFSSESSINLQWRKPDHPNGEIIAYNLYWRKVRYSFWEDNRGLDWCKRDVKTIGKDENEKLTPEGSCKVNTTCICDAEKESSKAVKADRDEFNFQREFREHMNRVLFVKNKTGKKAKKETVDNAIFSSVVETTKYMPTTVKTTRKVIRFQKPNVFLSGNNYSYVVKNLDYFQGYKFVVCACTDKKEGGGCTVPSQDIVSNCAVAQARTAIRKTADNLHGKILVDVNGAIYNISWLRPKKPNAVVLKYEISIRFGKDHDDVTLCQMGSLPTHLSRTVPAGDYIAKVRAISPAGNGSWSESVSFTIEDTVTKKNTAVVIGVSTGAAILILIMLAVVVYYAFVRRNIDKGVPGVLYASVNPEYMNSNEVYIPDKWELNREKIELLRELGQGSFGMVYEGIAHNIANYAELRVAVKTVNENASIRDRIEFLQEASIMKAFNSNHVVKLIGVVSQGQPTFVVMELMGRGDLKTFLRSRRPEENSNFLPPQRNEMYQIAAEIADGLAYLAARKFVHRDLAARNCMVAVDFTVKIGDFGMARDIYETDYYRKGGKGLLPVRWMAPESLRDGIFTTASDIWSYGVVLWEIVTLASQPYQGKSNEEVLQFVLNNGQLEYPSDCDKLIQEFMDLCWSRDPKLRPSFLEIVRLLEDYVNEDFLMCSFYHEMKKKALEDTFCQETNLHEILGRPSSRTTKNGSIKLKRSYSICSNDSGAFIENSKSEAEETLEVSRHKADENDTASLSKPTSPDHASREESVYDNYGTMAANMKYGNTPVGQRDSQVDGGQDQLKLSKIFFGKPVPV